MRDALKSYLALAGGLVEVPRQKALAAAKALQAQGEATAEQVSGLAEDLVSQSRANRDAVTALVRFEVDRALGRVGLASNEEVGDLAARVQALEAEVRALRSRDGEADAGATSGSNASNGSDASNGSNARSSTSATSGTRGTGTERASARGLPSAADVKRASQAKARKTAPATKARPRAAAAAAPALHTAAEAKALQRDAARKSPADKVGPARAAAKAPALHSAADAKAVRHPEVPGSAGKES